MKIKTIFIVALLCLPGFFSKAQHTIASPDGRLKIDVTVGDDIQWSVMLDGEEAIKPSPIALVINADTLGKKPRFIRKASRTINETVTPVVPRKASTMKNHCNELELSFRGNYSIVFRAYDDGVAYRFKTSFKRDVLVNDEMATLNFPEGAKTFFPEEEDYISHNERTYPELAVNTISEKRFCSLPAMVTVNQHTRVVITDADLFDYPNAFLFGTKSNAFRLEFPPVVLKADSVDDRNERITEKADYIARTKGTRSLPWRLFVITKNDDGKIIENDLVYLLSRPEQIKDTEWIKPGKVAWDWWNANNIYDVDFKAGLNTATYKYYIDFASAYGIEYIILDEGWSRSTTDLTVPNPELDLQELIRYGNEKNVGIILWALWKPLKMNLEPLLDTFAKWGVKGVKADFFQRNDQEMVNFYETLARECAERKLLIDYHGAFKPAGLHRAYPNFITAEGVRGLETNKWDSVVTPRHDVILPFIRMVAGPMDYTPGAMNNAQKENFRSIFARPMSMGTRAHQVAMYVVYESPLQMMADAPTNYLKEPECTKYIAQIPVTWDETNVLEAKVGEYIVMARRKGDDWYLAAMGGWQPREFTIDLSFLPEGNYNAQVLQDGSNADRIAIDYQIKNSKVSRNDDITIKLAPGGGWVAVLKRQ